MTRPSRRRGASIVDLVIAIVIIGILIAIIYPRLKPKAAAAGTPARLAWVSRPDSAVNGGDSAEVAVRVEDSTGRPISGVAVEFLTSAGSSVVSPEAATTDAAGVVPVTWRFGAGPGRATLTARVRGRPEITRELAADVRALAPR